MLKMRNINKSYKKGLFHRPVKILQDVSLHIEEGETLGLIGESGCGKSTLARILTGLLSADSGSIEYNGKMLTQLEFRRTPHLRIDIQLMFQHPDNVLHPRKTVEHMLKEPYHLHPHLCPQAERAARIRQLLKTVGLSEEILSRYAHQISGGQAQRVVLARLLTLNPRLIVLDEPTSMLDVSVQAQILQLLKKIQVQQGLTYLFISHDLDVVRWMSDRIGVMHEGRLVECNQSDQILEAPQHAYTSALIRQADLSL